MEIKQRLNRRQFLKVSSGTSVALLLAACTPATPGGQSAGGEGAAPAGEVIKIQYQSREPENAAGISQLWNEWYPQFREANPSIEIEFLPDPGSGGDRVGTFTSMVAGVAPDLLEYCCSDSAFFMQQGQTLSLQSFIDRDAEEVNIDDYYAHQFDP